MSVTMKSKKALHTGVMWQISRPAVDAVLAFATAEIESSVQVERELSHAALALGFGDDQPPIRVSLGDGVLLPFARSAVARYQSDQKTLQRWLKKIVSWDKLRAKEKSMVLGEIKPWTERTDARLRSQVVGERLVRSISYNAVDVRQVIGEAMYLLFEHGIAQGGGVAVCPECQVYFVMDRSDQAVCSNRCRQRRYRRTNEDAT
jgi:hypothetical protein